MRKGARTRTTILEHAVAVAARTGLSGLTIGRLARDLALSKSGLFAHFRSKEELELAVLESGATRFVESVVKPALAAPRGEPRLSALVDRWIAWSRSDPSAGGCFFVAMASELDDRPGPARDRLVTLQREWLAVLATTAAGAVTEGCFHARVDPQELAQDAYGILLSYHHAARLLGDPRAEERARRAFARLLEASRAAALPGGPPCSTP